MLTLGLVEGEDAQPRTSLMKRTQSKEWPGEWHTPCTEIRASWRSRSAQPWRDGIRGAPESKGREGIGRAGAVPMGGDELVGAGRSGTHCS